MAETDYSQNKSQGLIGKIASGVGSFFVPVVTSASVAIGGMAEHLFSGSDKEEDSSVHYEGELGTFDYDPTQWTLEQKQNDTDDVTNQSDMVLKYIGEETDGNQIKIPDGLNSLDYSFAGTNITSVPEIPNSVKSTVSTFADCPDLKDITNAQEYMDNTLAESEQETYNESGNTDENNGQSTDEISQQAEGQKVYVINGDSDMPEIYTEQQIDTMRREVANADLCKDIVDTYKDYESLEDISAAAEANDSVATFNTRYYALTDGTYAEANAGEGLVASSTHGAIYDSDSANYEIMSEDSENDAASMYEKGEHTVTFDNGENWSTYDNQINVGTKTEGFDERYHRSESEIDHMKEILAEVDAMDGKGNYEDNLQTLQDGSYVEKTQQVASEKGEDLVPPEAETENEIDENGIGTISIDEISQILNTSVLTAIWTKKMYENGGNAGQALQDAYESQYGSGDVSNAFEEEDDEIYKNIENEYDSSAMSSEDKKLIDKSNKSNRSLRGVQDIADRVDEAEEESWSYGVE